MKNFSIKESVRSGWEIVKKHFWFAVGTSFVYMVFNMGFGVEDKWNKGYFEDYNAFVIIPLLILLGIILWVIRTIINMGYTRIYLKLQSGAKPAFKELFTNKHPFWKYVGANILYYLIIIGGLILFIVPGIIWAIKYQFMPVLVLDKGLGPKEAMKESARMTDGHKKHLLKFGMAIIGLNILGALCLFVGLFVTVPVSTLAFVHVYRKLS